MVLKRNLILIFIIMFCLLLTMNVLASGHFPEIEYTGYLVDAEDSPLHGHYDLIVSLYDASDAPIDDFLWQGVYLDTLLTDGVFTIRLGKEDNQFERTLFDHQLWLSITIDGVEQLPRYKLSASSYAMSAKNADDVLGKIIHPDAIYTGEVSTYSLSSIAIDTDSLSVKGKEVFGDNLVLTINTIKAGNKEILTSNQTTKDVSIKNLNSLDSKSITTDTLTAGTGSTITSTSEFLAPVIRASTLIQANSLAVTNNLIVDGRIGIGVDNPRYALDVSGDIIFESTLHTKDRMHISGGELLYILNKDGVIIGKEWGGTGDLWVQGELTTNEMITNTAGGLKLPDGNIIEGISYAQLERVSAQTFEVGWTGVGFESMPIGNGITHSGSQITFSQPGIYKISLGFRAGTGSDVWSQVRLFGDGASRGHSNSYGQNSGNDPAQFSVTFLTNITNINTFYEIQIGRHSSTQTVIHPTSISGEGVASLVAVIEKID